MKVIPMPNNLLRRTVFPGALLGRLMMGFLVAINLDVRAEAIRSSPVSVHVVPTSSHERTGQVIELYGDRHFHVVVQNLSSAPITLWEDWCSWGYFNLSFEAQYPDGRIFIISKKDRGWDKNFPCPTVIEAGQAWVIDVDLDPLIWENSPLSSGAGKAELQIKAIFEIREDEESQIKHVWTGRVSSPNAKYIFYWQRLDAHSVPRTHATSRAVQ